jgi:hypothetical protein
MCLSGRSRSSRPSSRHAVGQTDTRLFRVQRFQPPRPSLSRELHTLSVLCADRVGAALGASSG